MIGCNTVNTECRHDLGFNYDKISEALQVLGDTDGAAAAYC